ncbi:TetR/AcrR family transcriptional regulator [Nocardia sp. NPDC003693]
MTTARRTNRGPSAAAGNRAAILAAARTIFAQNGFDAPMSAIARTAGVGQGVLYRHFPNREAIALAVFDDNIAEIEARAADPGRTLDELLNMIVEQLTASAALIALIDPENTFDARLTDPATRLFVLISGKLDDPDQRGAVRAEATGADVIMALSMLAALLTKTDPSCREQVSRQAWNILSHGLFR